MLPNQSFLDIATKWDLEFFSAFDRHIARFFVLLRHRRSRKSTNVLNLLIREACRNPKKQYAYIFPVHKEAVKTIWRNPMMLFNYLPLKEEMGWVAHETDKFIKFANGSYLWLFGADDPDNLRGPDYHGVGLSEYPYMKAEVWDAVIKPIIQVGDPSRFAVFDFTPNGQNHGLDLWNNADSPGWWRQELRASESGIIPNEELVELRRTMPKWMYEQEYECSFITDEERTLITSAMLAALKHDKEVFDAEPMTSRILSIDPALDGDEGILMALENCLQLETRPNRTQDAMKIVAEALLMCSQYGIKHIVCDSIGLGDPICARLEELSKDNKIQIHRFDSREASINPKMLNRKAEAWWYAAEMIRDKKVPKLQDRETERQLCSVRYEFQDSSGRFKCESKDKTKKRLGRSPDRADAYIMGIYESQFINESIRPSLLETEGVVRQDNYALSLSRL